MDLCTPSSFYLARRDLVDTTLARLAAASPRELAAMVEESWIAHRGLVCRGVRWDAWTLSGLQAAACCIGGRGMAASFRALCINYRHLSGGLPDLLVGMCLIAPVKLRVSFFFALPLLFGIDRTVL